MDLLDRRLHIPFSNRTIPVKYALVHTAYWVLITGFFLYEKRYLLFKANLPSFVLCVVGRISLLVVVAYLNLHYFLPRYLLQGRYLRYFSVIMASILGYLIIQGFYDYLLYGFVIAPTQTRDWVSVSSYNFFSTLWYLGLMVALKLSIDWYEQKRLLQQITVEKLQAELNFLRTQVNPHFLFNVLNSLYALTLKKSDLAPEVVLKLSDMMEYMLYDSDETCVPLAKEISYLQNYIELEKIRDSGQSAISFAVEGHVNGQQIAPLLLLPLVENAFKHGVGRLETDAWLRGIINVDKTSVAFTVENNCGAGQPLSKGGIGLINLRRRLELLYPDRHSLQIENGKTSFKATLTISLP